MEKYDVGFQDDIVYDYFHWLCSIVHADDPQDSYIYLMEMLYQTEFYWIIDNDINRADDGKHLRYEFASERSYSNYYPIDNRPCSVLEMLIALAIRINDEIMWNPDYGDKTAAWFWEMIDNLGLGNLDDYCFEGKKLAKNQRFVEDILDDFMSCRDGKYGKISLFPTKNLLHFSNQKCTQKCNKIKNREIWYQMMDYMLEKYGVEED